MKVFISQRFRNLSKEQINATRLNIKEAFIEYCKKNDDDDAVDISRIEFIENWHPENYNKNSVSLLGESIKEMSQADIVLINIETLDNLIAANNTKEIGDVVDTYPKYIHGCEFELMVCLSYSILIKTYKIIGKRVVFE